MYRVAPIFVVVVVFVSTLFAQKISPPTNYYPASYTGGAFKGIVTSNSDKKLVLTYSKGTKAENFEGTFQRGCSVPNAKQQGRLMEVADIPLGTVMTVFYNHGSRQEGGRKVDENRIIAIAFNEYNGQKVPEEKRLIYLCTDETQMQYRAW